MSFKEEVEKIRKSLGVYLDNEYPDSPLNKKIKEAIRTYLGLEILENLPLSSVVACVTKAENLDKDTSFSSIVIDKPDKLDEDELGELDEFDEMDEQMKGLAEYQVGDRSSQPELQAHLSQVAVGIAQKFKSQDGKPAELLNATALQALYTREQTTEAQETASPRTSFGSVLEHKMQAVISKHLSGASSLKAESISSLSPISPLSSVSSLSPLPSLSRVQSRLDYEAARLVIEESQVGDDEITMLAARQWSEEKTHKVTSKHLGGASSLKASPVSSLSPLSPLSRAQSSVSSLTLSPSASPPLASPTSLASPTRTHAALMSPPKGQGVDDGVNGATAILSAVISEERAAFVIMLFDFNKRMMNFDHTGYTETQLDIIKLALETIHLNLEELIMHAIVRRHQVWSQVLVEHGCSALADKVTKACKILEKYPAFSDRMALIIENLDHKTTKVSSRSTVLFHVAEAGIASLEAVIQAKESTVIHLKKHTPDEFCQGLRSVAASIDRQLAAQPLLRR